MVGAAQSYLSRTRGVIAAFDEVMTEPFAAASVPLTRPLARAALDAAEAGGNAVPGPRDVSGESKAGTADPPTLELGAGTVLRSRYVLEQLIGRGGDSTVFRARDLHRGVIEQAATASIAIKVLLPERRGDRHALTRLKREFMQMQCLTHSGIARVFDLDCDADVWFMSMELVIGQTVSRWMRQPVGLRPRLMLIGACCEALEHAHCLGILHGDLKPSNVLVAHDKDVKLIDFGSAPSRIAGADATPDPSLAMTPSYASPQVLAGGGVEKRDDIFSLACLSYGILTHGRHPFDGRSSLDAYRARLCPAPVPGLPERLFAGLMRGLAPEREQRASSVREFLDGLMSADPNSGAVASMDTAVSAASLPQSSILAASARDAPPAACEPAAPTALGSAGVSPPGRGKPLQFLLRKRSYGVLLTRKLAARVMLPAVGRQVAVMASCLGGARGMSLAGWVLVIVWSVLQFRQMAPGSATNALHSSPTPAALAGSAPPAVAGVAPSGERVSPQPGAVSDPVPVAPPKRSVVHAAGAISFESSRMVVQAAQPLVAIPVKRLHATRGVGAVAWAVESGTARPGVDYKAVGPQVIRFIEGQTVRILFIPLIKRGVAAAHGPRKFVVTLRHVAGGPALGPVARVTVTIAAPQGAIGAVGAVAGGTGAATPDAVTSTLRPVRGELIDHE